MFELGKMNQYFKYFFNSKNKKVPVNIEAKDSATGKANQTPFIPINFGKIYINSSHIYHRSILEVKTSGVR